MCRLDLGRRKAGVYAVALSLTAGDGQLIEQRPYEPLVVLHKMTPKLIEGNDYTQGLDLRLEDTIDFTDPNDPHPWIESRAPGGKYGSVAETVTAPTIVRAGGLVYREVTDVHRSSGFSYRFTFEHPGSFYLMELEYPDDAKRTIGVLVSSKTENVWTNSQAGVGAETGGRFLNTGTIQKLRWIHVADPGVHSLDVINVVDGEKAAAKSLKIYRIEGDLPSMGAGEGRLYGIHSERCFYTSGIGMNFGVGQPRPRPAMQKEDDQRPPIQQVMKDLVWMQETGQRYVEYLKFAGQNCHVMGCFQYQDSNTPFVPAPAVHDSRVLHCMKTMMANLFDVNGIDFYAGVEFSLPQDVRSYANDAQVAQGAGTVWMVDSQGRQRYGLGRRGFTTVPNWLHPDYRARHRRLMEDVSRTFGHLAHFRGVHGCLGPSSEVGYWVPGFGQANHYDRPLDASFDDVTFAMFEQDTGIRIPVSVSDPQRFQKRAAVLGNPAVRRRFFQWRCEKLAALLGDAVATLRQRRPDVEMVNALWVEDTQFFRYLADSSPQKRFAAVMNEFAIDPDRLCAVDGLSVGRWTIGWRSGAKKLPSQDPYCWLARTSPDVISAFQRQRRRCVMVRTSWDENLFWSGGQAMKDRGDTDRLVGSDWIMNVERTRALPQPGAYHCREAFIQALITGDPELLLGGMTDININVGHEQMLRSVMATYTHLPREKFRPVLDTGLNTNLAIRQLNRSEASYFYVANPCQWHVAGCVTVRTDGRLTALAGGEPLVTAGRKESVDVPIRLEPFGLAAFRASSPNLEITAYRTEPMAAEELRRLEAVLDRVGELLAHPRVRLSLTAADRSFMRQSLAAARQAIADRQYALCWSMITDYRFWASWQDFLEPAARDARAASPPERAITYDKLNNCILVVGFPEEEPAMMDDLLAADRAGGWGKVTYDKARDTYTVDAAIWIGDDQSDGTFLAIGDARHPRVAVVVRGTVWVRPPKQSPPRSDGLESVINRLTLGDPLDASIRATLKIECRTRGEHGRYVGYRSSDNAVWIYRGSLRVYNSTITAAIEDEQHAWGDQDYTGENDPLGKGRWGRPGWYASDVRLLGATLSWFQGCPTYGVRTGAASAPSAGAITPEANARITSTVFEHGESAVRNGTQYLEGCVFRDLKAAVAEGGALSAKLVRCTFEDNRSNWTLGSAASRGLEMVDCRLGKQDNPITIRKNSISPDAAVARKVPVYPACTIRQSLRVQVVDSSGSPVPYAWVSVSCRADPAQVAHGATLTDENGLTPIDPAEDPIVVTAGMFEASDDPNAPRERRFSYEVTVTKLGFQPGTVALPAGRSIPLSKPLVVTLRPQAGP